MLKSTHLGWSDCEIPSAANSVDYLSCDSDASDDSEQIIKTSA